VLSCPAQAESESDIGGIGRLFSEHSEGLTRRNPMVVIPDEISADFHQPDEASFPAARNRKYVCKSLAVELRVVLAGDLAPALLTGRRLDEPPFQMQKHLTIIIRVNCVLDRHNSVFLEIAAHSFVLPVRDIVWIVAIS
jgi:hypothetical protein